jgi:asparagine synthase (glutamine-hydrolysing)
VCGIGGILSFSDRAPDEKSADQMIGALKHRGPDGQGVFSSRGIMLVHTRLSVIGLGDQGQQPMFFDDSRFALVYNGEVYNYRELRSELEAEGHRFLSQTDTEVVGRALISWGLDAVSRFDGMFALGIWDSELRTLTLARDRYGVKPLYFHRGPKEMVFASEVKAILALPRISRNPDLTAMQEYFSFQNIISERTLIESVRVFPPGSVKVFDESGNVLDSRKYWEWEWGAETSKMCSNENELEEELDSLFRAAVRRQMVSDVQVGSFLSGGIDSASIAAIGSQNLPKLNTFTVGSSSEGVEGVEVLFDERRLAQEVSSFIGSSHSEQEIGSRDFFPLLEKVARALDEPRVGQSYPNYVAAELARKRVKVVLSGTGGDEVFGGYPWRYLPAFTEKTHDDFVRAYFRLWHRLVHPDALEFLLKPIASQIHRDRPYELFEERLGLSDSGTSSIEQRLNASMEFEAKTFLRGLLSVEDKVSMAHGLEARVPFLDNELVDFALRLPVQARVNMGSGDRQAGPTSVGKVLLRKVLSRYVPIEVSAARKQGFSAPDATWFRGDLRARLRDFCGSATQPVWEFVDRELVDSQFASHFSGRTNKRLLIWSVLSINEWAKTTL